MLAWAISSLVPNANISAQAFFAAAFYLTLRHSVIVTCPQLSRIRPTLYTWIFIICDGISLLLQACGGGIAASASSVYLTNMGGRIMLAGIVFQVFTLTVLLGLGIDFILRLNKNRTLITPESMQVLSSVSFRYFLVGMAFAFIGIYTRCVYRIAELADGWANPIMRDETDFIILDGV